MKGTKAAYRYAKSLLDLAIEQNQLETAYEDMVRVNAICENRDMALLLASPIVKTAKKLTILDQVFGAELRTMSMGFIKLITKHRREDLLPGIASSFIRLYKQHKNILTAEVVSAVALDDKLREKVRSIVGQLNPNEIELNERVDPELLGGLILTVGDQQVDASLASRINALKTEFTKNPYIADF